MSESCVGILWGISDGGRMTLLADKTPIDQAESYGDSITHGTGHAEFWEELSRQGAAGLAARNLPTAPAWYPYEAYPRGRVVYWPNEQKFIIYVDRRLQGATFIAKIIAEFGISVGRFEVKSDPHYRAVRDLS